MQSNIREDYLVVSVRGTSLGGGIEDRQAKKVLEQNGFRDMDGQVQETFFPHTPILGTTGKYLLRYEKDVRSTEAILILQINGSREMIIDSGRVIVKDDKPNPHSEHVTIKMEGEKLLEWELECKVIPAPQPEASTLRPTSDPLMFGTGPGLPSSARRPRSPAPPSPTPAPPVPPPLPTPSPATAPSPTAAKAVTSSTATRQILLVPVKRIRPNPDQPRKTFKKSKLLLLGNSMRQEKQQMHIEVIAVDDDPDIDYEIIIGQRRWMAAQLVGITDVWVNVRSKEEIPDRRTQNRKCFAADSLHENYSDMEYALFLLEEKKYGTTNKELQIISGKSSAWISQHLGLNNLVPSLQKLLDPDLDSHQRLSFPIAYNLSRFPAEKQLEMHAKVMAITGPRLRLLEVKKLVNEHVPSAHTEKARRPIDDAIVLRRMVPRLSADAITADAYSERVLDSLIRNTPTETVGRILEQLGQAIGKLQSFRTKILTAQKLRATR